MSPEYENLFLDFIKYCAQYPESAEDIRIVMLNINHALAVTHKPSYQAMSRLNEKWWDAFRKELSDGKVELKKRHYVYALEHGLKFRPSLQDYVSLADVNRFWNLLELHALHLQYDNEEMELDEEDAELIDRVDDELSEYYYIPRMNQYQHAVIVQAARLMGYKRKPWLDPDLDPDCFD